MRRPQKATATPSRSLGGVVVVRLLLLVTGIPSAIFLRLPAVALWCGIFVAGSAFGATMAWYAAPGQRRRRRARRVRDAVNFHRLVPYRAPRPGTVYVGNGIVGAGRIGVSLPADQAWYPGWRPVRGGIR